MKDLYKLEIELADVLFSFTTTTHSENVSCLLLIDTEIEPWEC